MLDQTFMQLLGLQLALFSLRTSIEQTQSLSPLQRRLQSAVRLLGSIAHTMQSREQFNNVNVSRAVTACKAG